ncbi:WD40 repeat-like protein [Punctularia strigosozonata HHB-11173 SS5]|uniref:WD40 repeat-like protein n=1 Tax=Punctularia strigosozonata (strain HHB-11173) TaxID=741275 RepID=R7S4R8_PUNST|nr:WD40 repeat-like protein [Punctularia strigosozonata HHB-11173 SS5]EIN04879.1 WD40 repeat-like protein [Punctularia strigosozonata HHB-11173 SS5]
MSAPNDHEEQYDGDGEEAYIEGEEILAVYDLPEDGDHPMDEDEDEAADQLGDLPGSTSGAFDEANYENNSIQQFTEHGASVFCASVHPTQPLAVSGGEDEVGYIWDITTGQAVVKLTGHSDSIVAVEWSHDGEMIATGGMDGKTRIWRRVGATKGKAAEDWSTWEFLTELYGPNEVTWLKWHPKGHVLLAGSQDQLVWMWQLPSGRVMQVFGGHAAPVCCGTFTPDGKRIVTADEDGTFIIFDPHKESPLFKLSPTDARFDLDGITALAVNPSSTLAVVGGAAGDVRIISLSKGEIVGSLPGHKAGESVEAITFVDIGVEGVDVVVTAGTDSKAYVWDVVTMRLRATLEHEDPITRLITHPAQPHILVSGSADMTLRSWDARSGTLLAEHKGHRAPVLDASLGMEGKVLVSAGDDGACLVFTTQ